LSNRNCTKSQSTGTRKRFASAIFSAGAVCVTGLSLAGTASAAQNVTGCQLLAGAKTIRIADRVRPCDSITTVNTSVSKLVKKGKKSTTVWSWATAVVPLPAGCTIAAAPAAKKCKLVRAATEKVVLWKADPVRFAGSASFSDAGFPVDLKKFSTASVDFVVSCEFDNSDRFIVGLKASGALATKSSSSGITAAAESKPAGLQTFQTSFPAQAFGADANPAWLDRQLVVTPDGNLGQNGMGMFTYLLDVGPATITVNASYTVSTPPYYYAEGEGSTCTVNGSAFTTLDS